MEGLSVAILIENGFERVEMVEPRKALDQAGARLASFLRKTRACTP
jgi:putative intracellular protease/amidase